MSDRADADVLNRDALYRKGASQILVFRFVKRIHQSSSPRRPRRGHSFFMTRDAAQPHQPTPLPGATVTLLGGADNHQGSDVQNPTTRACNDWSREPNVCCS